MKIFNKERNAPGIKLCPPPTLPGTGAVWQNNGMEGWINFWTLAQNVFQSIFISYYKFFFYNQ